MITQDDITILARTVYGEASWLRLAFCNSESNADFPYRQGVETCKFLRLVGQPYPSEALTPLTAAI